MKPIWTLEELETGLKRFFTEHGRYPTSTEINKYEHLPSSRTIERSFGGLVALREKLKLGKEYDFREGSHSSKRAHTINKRAHKVEQEVYEHLLQKFKREFVHREYFFTDDTRTRADFFVYDNQGGFCVDVFYPSSTQNLNICLNLKLQKYHNLNSFIKDYPVIFLQMNKEISQGTIDNLMKRKKRSIPAKQYVMDWESFQRFCKPRRALNVEPS